MAEIFSQTDLQQIADAVAKRVALNTKNVLTFDEACIYTGLRKSSLYKKTMTASVPCYKPNGKLVYFNREELTAWLLSNRCATEAEIADRAQSYCMKKGGRQ